MLKMDVYRCLPFDKFRRKYLIAYTGDHQVITCGKRIHGTGYGIIAGFIFTVILPHYGAGRIMQGDANIGYGIGTVTYGG